MAHLATGILGAVELGGNLAGVPFVAGVALLLKEIVQSCEEMRIHKRKSKHIRNQCVQFLLVLDEQNRDLDPKLVESLDEMNAILERIQGRMTKWSRLSAWSLILKRSEIDEGLQECESNLTASLQRFNITAQAVNNRAQRSIQRENQARHEELKALLIAMNKPSETAEIIAMERTGSQVAEQLMQAGQEQLREDLLYSHEQCDSPMQEDQLPDQGLQDALFRFHLETGTLPTIKVLNAEISKVEQSAVAGGTYSDIWLGLWLGKKKVALKGLRSIKVDHPGAKMRIEREVKMWSSLKSEHILPFYGIVTNLGNHIHMVSPWQENGNVLKFLKSKPEANRRRLIGGAAQGLAYLHSMKIVHGNVKCTNILVLDNGEACICDFGMSKLIEEVTEKSASATLTAAGSARWLAPELIDGTISSPTFETDTYSFGMAILELLTGKYPFAERKRDASVIHDVVVRKVTPARPQGCAGLNEGLWQLLTICWHNTAAMRPSMANVVSGLKLLY